MSDNWAEEKLRAAVEAYVQMHSEETNGIPFVKKQIYSQLAKCLGRIEKLFESQKGRIYFPQVSASGQ